VRATHRLGVNALVRGALTIAGSFAYGANTCGVDWLWRGNDSNTKPPINPYADGAAGSIEEQPADPLLPEYPNRNLRGAC